MKNELTKDAVELLIISKNGEQDARIEKIYVKQADFDRFFNALLAENVYFKGIKWLIGFILFTFSAGIVVGAYKIVSGFFHA